MRATLISPIWHAKDGTTVIRVKDLDSSGILSGLRLPAGGAFDLDVHLTLTKKQTKAVKAHPYPISFRIVRFVLPSGDYETVIYVCRQFLRSHDDEPPPDAEALIRKNILPIRPIRPGQMNTRKIRYKSAVSFVYRVA